MPIPRGFTKIFGSDPSKMTKEGARKIVDAFKDGRILVRKRSARHRRISRRRRTVAYAVFRPKDPLGGTPDSSLAALASAAG